jgi:hypothetical protein
MPRGPGGLRIRGMSAISGLGHCPHSARGFGISNREVGRVHHRRSERPDPARARPIPDGTELIQLSKDPAVLARAETGTGIGTSLRDGLSTVLAGLSPSPTPRVPNRPPDYVRADHTDVGRVRAAAPRRRFARRHREPREAPMTREVRWRHLRKLPAELSAVGRPRHERRMRAQESNPSAGSQAQIGTYERLLPGCRFGRCRRMQLDGVSPPIGALSRPAGKGSGMPGMGPDSAAAEQSRHVPLLDAVPPSYLGISALSLGPMSPILTPRPISPG